MALARITREEQLGLGVAAVAHAALAWVLMTRESPPPPIVVEPKPVVVTLSTDVGLTSTAPDPVPEAAMAPPSSSSLPDAPPASQPDEFVPAEVPAALPTLGPTPAPTARATRRPTPTPTSRASRTPTPRATPTPSSRRRNPAPTPSPSASRRNTGFDGAFGSGTGTSNSSSNSGTQAAEIGPAVRSSLAGEITRQLRPHWTAPQGVDVELLVTRVRFRLNRDGSLSGSPSCVGQSGVNASNRAQKDAHCERAIRAVRLAAPFNLPEQYHEAWKTNTWSFDRNL